MDLTTETWTDLRHAGEQTLTPDWVSVPRAVSWPSTLDDVPGEVHGWYYPPTNPGHTAPDGELPPLITISHGGPTSFSDTGFSRVAAVLDLARLRHPRRQLPRHRRATAGPTATLCAEPGAWWTWPTARAGPRPWPTRGWRIRVG